MSWASVQADVKAAEGALRAGGGTTSAPGDGGSAVGGGGAVRGSTLAAAATANGSIAPAWGGIAMGGGERAGGISALALPAGNTGRGGVIAVPVGTAAAWSGSAPASGWWDATPITVGSRGSEISGGEKTAPGASDTLAAGVVGPFCTTE